MQKGTDSLKEKLVLQIRENLQNHIPKLTHAERQLYVSAFLDGYKAMKFHTLLTEEDCAEICNLSTPMNPLIIWCEIRVESNFSGCTKHSNHAVFSDGYIYEIKPHSNYKRRIKKKEAIHLLENNFVCKECAQRDKCLKSIKKTGKISI